VSEAQLAIDRHEHLTEPEVERLSWPPARSGCRAPGTRHCIWRRVAKKRRRAA